MPTLLLDYNLKLRHTLLLHLKTKDIFRGLDLHRDSKKSSFYTFCFFLSTCNKFIVLQVNRKHGCHYTSCFVPCFSSKYLRPQIFQ